MKSDAMEKIIERAAVQLAVTAEPDGISEIAQRTRGTPRVALAPSSKGEGFCTGTCRWYDYQGRYPASFRFVEY